MARTTKTTTKTKKTSIPQAPSEARRADPAGASAVTPGAARVAVPKAATPDAKPSPAAAAAPASPARPDPAPATASGDARKGPGFFPLLLGGVVAGGIGFAAATWGVPQPEWATSDDARIDALAAELEALKAAEVPTFDAAGLEAAQADLSTRLDALSNRVDALEAAPVAEPAPSDADGTTEAAAAPAAPDAPVAPTFDDRALRAEIASVAEDITALDAALTPRVTALEEAVSEADARNTSAVDEAQALAREAARNQVRLALQSGAPFAEPLAVLGDAPEALASVAETGVPAQAVLIDAFPDLSRDALRAARASAPSTGVGSLFQNAFNPRSLTPREGNDPDAVLSRAEAAVRDGDLALALSEVETLPDDAKAVLAPWISRVETRAAALLAADAYLQDG